MHRRSSQSCGTPRPFEYLTPRLNCAFASPCSAAKRSASTRNPQQFIAPNGFKAQVVAVSRDVAVTYKETLDRLNGPESALIMSSAHNDEERLARWHLRKDDQDRLIERFKDKDDPLAILVVCDMLLTGFDVPVEQVMYLDSPLKEHTLLQAIARVNRPHGDEKTYGLVVDYWGVSEELQDALAIFSPTDIQGALTPKVDELPRLQTRHAAAMRCFQKVTDKTDLDACVRVLEPEDVRAEFDLSFRRFSQSMDMMLPDTRALAYNSTLRWLGKIRGTAHARYHDDRLDLSGCGEKVRQLIAEAVVADGIQILVTEVPLFSKEFEAKVEALKTDDAKASEMEHAIRHEINVRVEANPVFYQSLREQLEQLIRVQDVTPHVAQKVRGSAIDGRTTRHAGYHVSQRKRKLVEQVFGWMKTVGGLRKLRHRGIALVDWQLTFAATAYNLVRLRNLEARCP